MRAIRCLDSPDARCITSSSDDGADDGCVGNGGSGSAGDEVELESGVLVVVDEGALAAEGGSVTLSALESDASDDEASLPAAAASEAIMACGDCLRHEAGVGCGESGGDSGVAVCTWSIDMERGVRMAPRRNDRRGRSEWPPSAIGGSGGRGGERSRWRQQRREVNKHQEPTRPPESG